MEEKNVKKKGTKLIVFVIVGLLLVILLGMQVFASVKGYGNIFFMVKDLTKPAQAHGKQEILIDDEKTKEKNAVEVNENKQEELSNTDVKATVQKYYDIIGAGTPNGVLTALGFEKSKVYLNNPKKIEENNDVRYVETEVDYSDFEKEIKSIMSEKLYDEKYGDNKLFKNQNGKVYCFDGGMTGTEIKVETVKEIEKNVYEVEMYLDYETSKEESKSKVTFVEENGKMVIDSVEDLDVKDEEITSKVDTDVKTTVQKYYDIIGAGTPNGVLTALGFEKSKVYLNNPKKIEENNDVRYVETEVDYSDFEKEIKSIMSEKLYDEKYGDNKLFKNQNGKVYCFDGGMTGTEIKVETVKEIEKNVYEVEMYLDYETSKEESKSKVTFVEENGKLVIDSVEDLDKKD